MKKCLLLTLVITVQASILWACTCVPIPTFCETITLGNDGAINEYLTIVKVEVTNKETNGIDVKIETILFGESTSQELFINRGNGASCTIDTDIFSEGEIFIFSLHIPTSTQEIYLGDCGVNYLKIENEIVTGPVAPDLESIAFDQFNTIECFEELMVSNSELSLLKNSFDVFPNPNAGNFYISNTIEIPVDQTVELEIVDLQGKVIYKEQKAEGWLPNDEWRINVSEVTDGIYFLKIFIEEKSTVLKIVKM